MRLESIVRRVAEGLIVIIVLLIVLSSQGKLFDKGSGASYKGGFGAGTWDGSPSYDAEHYKYGVIEASTSIIADLCGPNSSSYFPGGADALYDGGTEVDAFWLVTSYKTATDVCDPPFAGSASEWGLRQADFFANYLIAYGYHTKVKEVFGDVERHACVPPPCGPPCDPDLNGWLCSSKTDNVQVVKGFEDRLAERLNFRNGLYTTPGDWEDITDDASSSSVGTSQLWMASWCAGQSVLDSQVFDFDEMGFYIFSWQYVGNQSSLDDCVICEVTFENAKDRAEGSSEFVPRWDVWTNSNPDIVCE